MIGPHSFFLFTFALDLSNKRRYLYFIWVIELFFRIFFLRVSLFQSVDHLWTLNLSHRVLKHFVFILDKARCERTLSIGHVETQSRISSILFSKTGIITAYYKLILHWWQHTQHRFGSIIQVPLLLQTYHLLRNFNWPN